MDEIADLYNHPTAFRYLLRVRYGECDAQQVVFNARYADYIDVAMTEYFRALIGGFKELMNRGYDNQVVSLHIDWLSSASFDDVLELVVAPKHIGNTSYAFNLHIYNQSNKKLIAKSLITYVLVDSKSYTKKQVPDWLREKIRDEVPFSIVNHAQSSSG